MDRIGAPVGSRRGRLSSLALAILVCSWTVMLPATDAQTSEGATIEAPGPSGPLIGTLLNPAPGSAPIVLTVPGSGPVDRDGNGPGIVAATYRLLAEGLAARGIATVRIDKRGMYGSRAAVVNANAVTIEDYAADLRAWVATIRRESGARCIWVLGHSEGGLVALAAAPDLADLCGLVLVATAGRPLGTVLREQLRANPANAPLLDQALAAIASLEAGRPIDPAGMHPALVPLFRPEVQGFLLSEIGLDPARLIANCRVPILILQGDRDLQIRPEDAERLHQANPASRLVLVPGANHVLKEVPSEDLSENLAAYANPRLPLATGVVEAIAEFIAEGETRSR